MHKMNIMSRFAHEGGEVQGNAAALLNMLDKKVLACEVAFVTTIVIDDTTSIPVIRVVTKE